MRSLVISTFLLVGCGSMMASASGTASSDRRSSGQIAECGSEARCTRACNDGDTTACHDLGLVLLEQRALDEAVDAFGRGCDHGELSCCARQVATLRELGRDGEADALVRHLCWGEGSGERCRAFAELSESHDPSPETEAVFEQRCDGGDRIACRDLGRSLERRGLLDQAAIHFEQACDAGDLEGCLGLADVLSELDRAHEAERARERANELGARE